MKNRYRTTCVGSVFAVLVVSSCAGGKGSFALVNKASEPVARASVTICKQSRVFKDIQPGHSVAGCYAVKADDHYVIEVAFESGKTLRKETGYVTSEMDFQDEITITDADIELISKGVGHYSE